jgi:hypothetical protein
MGAAASPLRETIRPDGVLLSKKLAADTFSAARVTVTQTDNNNGRKLFNVI